MEGYRDVIVQTYNLPAFLTIKNFSPRADAQFFDIISQIDICMRDLHWFRTLSFVFPTRNRVARYTARIRMKLEDRLYTLDRPIAGIEELTD